MNGNKILANTGVYQEMKQRSDGYWIWLRSEKKPDCDILGKYLFFHENKDRLIEIARNEIDNHGFHEAKVSVREGETEHVLCLYYKDDSRKQELADRNKQEYGAKYRYWKSDEATLKGQYSQEFLSKLPKSERKHFTSKERSSNLEKEGKLILRQASLKSGKKSKTE